MAKALFATLKRSALALPFLVAHRRYRAARSVRDLTPVRVGRAIRPREVVCNTVVRNETMRLPDFFRHHRALGIEKFVVIDNASTDGTVEFLLDQPDVDLYSTTAPYARSHFGMLWFSGLLRRLHPGGWVLQVDADEHLVYDGCEHHDLPALAALLEASGRRSLPSMMVDMYARGRICDALPSPGDRLVDVCPLFDAYGYRVEHPEARWEVPRIVHHAGGARERLFSTDQKPFRSDLAKTPLVRWDADVTHIYTHAVHPYALNFGAPTGSLLHFKLLKDFHDRAKEAVALNNHYDGSSEYRRYLAKVDAEPDMSAEFGGSRRYENSRTLVDAGLMTSIDWRA